MHVQHSDFDALLCEQVHDNLANAITSSRHDNYFLTPYIRIVRPVICNRVIKPGADFIRKPENKQRLEMLPSSRMISNGAITVNRVFTSQEQRQCEQRIERRKLEKAHKGVACNTWADVNHARIKTRRRLCATTYLHVQDSIHF